MSQSREKTLNDLPKFQKILEDIIEFLLSKDNEEENFLVFCEQNLIEKIIEISGYQEKDINLIIIKTFAILIPSLKNNKIMFYLFSNNYMNQIITNISYNKEDNDTDYLSFYINFLKTLVNKLDINSFSLFFNSSHNKFPLLDEIVIFLTYDQDVMIKNTSRNIFLSLLNLKYEPFIEYICDLPTITLFIFFAENLKEQMKYFCQNSNNTNINNNNNFMNKINEREEKEEILKDDISFIQDILNINISKINYLLINILFYIPLSYLFNNIITRNKANISYYILELFFEILKNEAIKNIIIFILYSSYIQIKIIEITANEETNNIYRLLKLNKCLFHSNINNIKNSKFKGDSFLSFDDYIILNYSKKFLNSLRYVRDTDNTYDELKNISNQLNFTENPENNIDVSIKLLTKKIDRINYVLKNIENYHGFISRATGINCGVSHNSAKDSFLQIVYNNLIAYKENNVNKNIYLQQNILRNECNFYITDFYLKQSMCTVNELFLLHSIINSDNISKELKYKLNLFKNSLEKSKKEYSDIEYININSIEDIDISGNYNDNGNESKEIEKKSNSKNINFDAPPVVESNDTNLTTIQPKFSDLYKNTFGENCDNDENDIDNSFNISHKKSKKYFSVMLILPRPINNNINLMKFNNNINLIINNKIMNYKDMDFNNDFFDRILVNYKTNNELKIVENLIELLTDGRRFLNKLIYKFCIDIIEDLLLNSVNFWSIKNKYQKKINEHYKQILQMINSFLEKNNNLEKEKEKYYNNDNAENDNSINLLKKSQEFNNFLLVEEKNDDNDEDNKNLYELFEKCFILNTKDISEDIKKNIFKRSILLALEFNEEEKKYYEEEYDLLKIPKEKFQTIKCLFQKLFSLYDLKLIINGFNDISQDQLLKHQKFPLYLFEQSEYEINKKINIIKINVEFFKIQIKLVQEEQFSDYVFFFMKNYIIFCALESKNIITKKKEQEKKEDKKNNNEFINTIKDEGNGGDNNKCHSEGDYIVKEKIPLRHLKIFGDENGKNEKGKNFDEKILFLNNIKNKSKIILLFENSLIKTKMKEIIKNNIKNAVEMEYNSLQVYFDKLLKDFSTINK